MATIYNSQLDAYSLYHKYQEEETSILGGPALPALGHALAGSTGTAISNLVLYPLDLIITRLQVQRHLRKSAVAPSDIQYQGVLNAFERIYTSEGGVSAFYTGVVQSTGKSIADSFLFFLFYNYLRTNRLQKHGAKATTLPVLDELAVGAIAGSCSKLFTTPIANIVTRKQTATMVSQNSSHTKEPSVSEIAASIQKEKGIQGFWSGYSASLILTLNPSITFFLYEFFKRTMLPRSKRDDPGARVTFLMAAISKAVASTITYPFSLAKTRAQVSSKAPGDEDSKQVIKNDVQGRHNVDGAAKATEDAKKLAKQSTVFSIILHIYRTEGLTALYEGVSGEITKGFFSHGITMLLKETIHKLIIQAYYIALKVLKKYPDLSELALQARSTIQSASGRAEEIVNKGYEGSSSMTETLVQNSQRISETSAQKLSNVASNATEMVKSSYDKVNEGLNKTAEKIGTFTDEVSEAAKANYSKMSEQAGIAIGEAREAIDTGGKRVGVVGNSLVEAAKTSTIETSKEARGFLDNARDNIGTKIIETGKQVKKE